MSDLQDEFEVRSLVDVYMEASNRSDTKAMAALFTEDGVLEALGNPEIKGQDKIKGVFDFTLGSLDFIHQTCSGALIKVDGAAATGRWSVTEFTRKTGGKLGIFLGFYDDQYVRTAEGWRFARRTLTQKARARFEAEVQG